MVSTFKKLLALSEQILASFNDDDASDDGDEPQKSSRVNAQQSMQKKLVPEAEVVGADVSIDDLMERGITCAYNPQLLLASTVVPYKHKCFSENFIWRDKSTKTFIMYEQSKKQHLAPQQHNDDASLSHKRQVAKTKKALLKNARELMRARYHPGLKEFWIFNANMPLALLDSPEYAMAKLIWSRSEERFVLKNKYCVHCTNTSSNYSCSPHGSEFQQELAHFSIALKRVCEGMT